MSAITRVAFRARTAVQTASAASLRTAPRRWMHASAAAASSDAAAAAAAASATPAAPVAASPAAAKPARSSAPRTSTPRSSTPATVTATAPAQPRSRTAVTPPLLLMKPRPPFLFFSAPLEDVSDSAWRRLVYAEGRGADLTFAEMSRVENLARKSTNRTGSSWSKISHHQEADYWRQELQSFAPLANEESSAAAARYALLESHQLAPTVVQLLVNKDDSLRQFLERFEPTPGVFAGFNLNMGCPSPDVMKLGLGAQSVKRIAKCQRNVEMLNEFIAKRCSGPEWALGQLPAGVSARNGAAMDSPMRPGVSIKIRLGANHREQVLGTHINLIRALRGDTPQGSKAASTLSSSSAAASGPVSYFILHARHGGQHYDAPSDFGAIARTILHTQADNVIANGDIHTLAQVRRCAEMGAAGVMVGRAAVKDPHIFARLKEGIRTNAALNASLPILDGPLLPADAAPLRTITRKDGAGKTPQIEVVPAPARVQPSPAALITLYNSFAKAYVTPEKYQTNVTTRIGKVFEPNPRPATTTTSASTTAATQGSTRGATTTSSQTPRSSSSSSRSQWPPPRSDRPRSSLASSKRFFSA